MRTSTPTQSNTFTAALALPKFRQNQRVRFLGGTGLIKTYRPDARNWTYTVEMELGPEPEIGRVGPETTVLLYESDIQGILD